MSLAKTLMKVAIGVAVAKGVSTLAKNMGGGGSASSSGGGLGDVLGGMLGGGSSSSTGTTRPAGRSAGQSGGLGDLMGDLLGNSGGNATRSDRSSRGGDLLEEVLGQKRTSSRTTAPKGGLQDVLEQMTGARSGRGGQNAGQTGGGIGDLLGSILGTSAARPAGGSLRIEEEEEVSAALMLKAIIQAVKCDGDLDAAEKKKLMEAMGDATQAEVQAVNAELSAPVDVDALVRMVPNGMEAQVYLVSLSAINLDRQEEAQYLHALAQGLELQPHEVNALHDRAGVPHIYR